MPNRDGGMARRVKQKKGAEGRGGTVTPMIDNWRNDKKRHPNVWVGRVIDVQGCGALACWTKWSQNPEDEKKASPMGVRA